jgi:hypothetical protein
VPHRLELQQTQPHAEQDQAAGRGDRQDGRPVHHIGQQEGATRDAALHHQHGDHRQVDARPECRGKRNRRDPVEQRLGGKQRDVAAQPVIERPEDGQRPDTEDQAGGHEALGDPAGRALAAGQPALEPSAERLEAVMQTKQLPNGHSEQQRGQHGEFVPGAASRVGEDAQRHRRGDDQREEAQARGQALLHPSRHASSGKQPQRRAHQDGGDVEQSAGQEHGYIVRT